jgi:hypothetical protein
MDCVVLQAGSSVFVRYKFPPKDAVRAHIDFWKLFFAKEMVSDRHSGQQAPWH